MELQQGRAAVVAVELQQNEVCENMQRMVMQSETPVVRTCARARAIGTYITPDDTKGDWRSDMCLTCSARDPNSGLNKDEYDIHRSGTL
eukprot:3206973-Heterocapsa_arctica.AAC.1